MQFNNVIHVAQAARELQDALRQRGFIPRGYPNSEARQLAEHALSVAIDRTRDALMGIKRARFKAIHRVQARRAVEELWRITYSVMNDGADYIGMEATAGTAANVLFRSQADYLRSKMKPGT